MKARKENNGQIKIYGVLPSKWKGVTGNYAGGFHKVNKKILEKEGFFDVILPECNRTLQVLSEIFFDERNQIYTYDVLPKAGLPTIEQAKINKIKELKNRAKEKFNETDWYYIREIHAKKKGKNEEVPLEIISYREKIYNLIDLKEKEINNLSDLEKVLNFDTNLENQNEKKIKEEPITEVPITPPITPPVTPTETIPSTSPEIPTEIESSISPSTSPEIETPTPPTTSREIESSISPSTPPETITEIKSSISPSVSPEIPTEILSSVSPSISVDAELPTPPSTPPPTPPTPPTTPETPVETIVRAPKKKLRKILARKITKNNRRA